MVEMIGRPNPMREEVVQAYEVEGKTIAEMMEGVDSRFISVNLNGVPIPKDMWKNVRPKAGTTLQIVAQLQGNEGNKKFGQVMIMVAMLAASVALPGAFPSLVGWKLAMATLAVNMTGMLLMRALVKPPPQPKQDNTEIKSLNSITGSSNQARQYGAVPLVLGKVRFMPPYAAEMYSTYTPDSQKVHLLFDLGYGSLIVRDPKLGETPIADISGAGYEVGAQPSSFVNDAHEEQVGKQFEITGTETRTTQPGTTQIGFEIQYPQGLFGLDKTSQAFVAGKAKWTVEFRAVGTTPWTNLASYSFPAGGWSIFPYVWGRWTYDNISGTSTQFVVQSNDRQPFNVGMSWQVPEGQYEVRLTLTDTMVSEEIKVANGPIPATTPRTVVLEPQSPAGTVLGLVDSRKVSYLGGAPIYEGSASGVEFVYAKGTRYERWFDAVLGTDFSFVNGNQVIFADNALTKQWGGGVTVQDYRITYRTRNTGTYTVQNSSWITLRSFSTKLSSLPSLTTTKLALQLIATAELNGSISQFSCEVSQQIPVWNSALNGGAGGWETKESSNPAWIYHWLLTACPANSRLVAASRLDFNTLLEWATFCDNKGLTFNKVVEDETTLGEVLMMICAAGRATFTVRDCLYSVVMDTQQTTPRQHFTPRNSWGFRGKRVFADEVHALRCRFQNPSADYQMDEMIVYQAGYDAVTATNFETMDFPGVTDYAAVWKLAKYHLAVLKYRQNEHEFQCDVEHLACTRGDLIKVAHDVPRWGLGWGRITSLPSSTVIKVDEDQDKLNPGTQYSLRVRRQDGSSATYTATRDTTDPRKLTTTVAHSGLNQGDLCMLGEPGLESANLIITKISPAGNLAATITAVDEAPQVYTADSGTPPVFASTINGKVYEEAPPAPKIVVYSNTTSNVPGAGGLTSPDPIAEVILPVGWAPMINRVL